MDMPLSFLSPDVIIFDCDGVLFDSRKANQFFYNHLLEHFGNPSLTETDLVFVHMHTAGESISYLFGEDHIRDAVLAYNRTLDYFPFIRLMEMEPGLIDFLDFIRLVVKTAVSTNRSTTIGQVLKTFSLEPYFDLVISSLDVSQPKPDPESVFKILNYFQMTPEQCWYIGDSEIDAQTAGRAGVLFVAYKNSSLPADFHVQGFSELKDYFKDSRGQGVKDSKKLLV
jgi:phosphoglycolate phosphatase